MFHLNGDIIGFRSQVKKASNIERKVTFPWLDMGVKGSTGLGRAEYQGMMRMNFLQEVVCCSCLKPESLRRTPNDSEIWWLGEETEGIRFYEDHFTGQTDLKLDSLSFLSLKNGVIQRLAWAFLIPGLGHFVGLKLVARLDQVALSYFFVVFSFFPPIFFFSSFPNSVYLFWLICIPFDP